MIEPAPPQTWTNLVSLTLSAKALSVWWYPRRKLWKRGCIHWYRLSLIWCHRTSRSSRQTTSLTLPPEQHLIVPFWQSSGSRLFLSNWGDRFLMFASSFRANPRFPRRERAPQHEHYPWPTSPFTKWTASSLRLRREGLYGHISIDVQIFGDLHFGATRVKSGRTRDDVANNHGRNDSPKRVAFKRRSRHNGSITSYLPAKYDYHIF